MNHRVKIGICALLASLPVVATVEGWPSRPRRRRVIEASSPPTRKPRIAPPQRRARSRCAGPARRLESRRRREGDPRARRRSTVQRQGAVFTAEGATSSMLPSWTAAISRRALSPASRARGTDQLARAVMEQCSTSCSRAKARTRSRRERPEQVDPSYYRSGAGRAGRMAQRAERVAARSHARVRHGRRGRTPTPAATSRPAPPRAA